MSKKYFKKILMLALALAVAVPALFANTGTVHAVSDTYYVSPNGSDSNNGESPDLPFKTIGKARDVVRAQIAGGMNSNITVNLMGGTYNLASAVSFNSSDSGRDGYRVIYKNYQDEVPVIVGGESITGWSLYDASKNIYVKAVGAGQNINNLVENGIMAVKARYPNYSEPTVYSEVQEGEMLQNGNFESGSTSWTISQNASVVSGYGHWGSSAMRVGSTSGYGYVYQNNTSSDITPQKEYTLRCYASSTDLSVQSYIGVTCMKSDGSTASQQYITLDSTTLKAYSLSFTPPAETVRFQVYMYRNQGNGYSYYDNISLMRNIYKSFKYDPSGLPAFADVANLECYIWPGGPDGEWNWFANTLNVEAIDETRHFIDLESNATYELGAGTRYVLQGKLELLDQAGEFFYNNNTGNLFYKPRLGGAPQNVIIGKIYTLFNFQGSSPESTVKDITLQGLELSVTNFPDTTSSYSAPTVYLNNAEGIVIEGCEIHNSGCYAIFGYDKVEDCAVKNNLIYDIGMGGVSFFGPNSGTAVNKNNTITNNHIYNVGRLKGDASGIQINQSSDNTITYNRVHDSKRFGIMLSGVYGQGSSYRFATGNVIQFNDVFNCMTDSQDGAPVYSWSSGNGQTGNTIANNMIHDSNFYFSYGFGFYLDDFTDSMLVENNLIYGMQRTPAGGHTRDSTSTSGSYSKFYNNVIADFPDNTNGVIFTRVNSGLDGILYDTTNLEYGKNIIYNASPENGVIFDTAYNNTGRYAYLDYNLYYNQDPDIGYRHQVDSTILEMSAWQSTYGFDTHTVTDEDPLFMDAANDDYRLKYDSPAYSLGFKDIDPEPIGLLASFPYADTGEEIERLFVKTVSTNCGQSRISLLPGNTAQLTVSGRTVNGYLINNVSGVSYSSDNSSVASVSASGTVTGNAQGTAKITASTGGKSVSIYVTVTAESANIIQNPSFDADSFNTQTPTNWYTWTSGGHYDADYTQTQSPHTGARNLAHWKNGSFDVFTGQTVTGLQNGTYTAKVWAKTTGGPTTCVLKADNFGGTAMYAYITGTEYQEYTISNIPVTNGQCTIGVYTVGDAGKYAVFDDFSLTRDINIIQNPSFDADSFNTQTPTNWYTWTSGGHYDADYTQTQSPHTGARNLAHWKNGSFDVYTGQTVTGLQNGTYTAKVWAKTTGGPTTCFLKAENFGSTAMYANITGTEYQEYTISNIQVTNGQCAIGVYTVGDAGKYAVFDDFSLTRDS